jgi:hypothetical protein
MNWKLSLAAVVALGSYLAYDVVIGGAKRQMARERQIMDTQPERFAAMRAAAGRRNPPDCGCGG